MDAIQLRGRAGTEQERAVNEPRPARRTSGRARWIAAVTLALLGAELTARLAERPRLVTVIRLAASDGRMTLHRPVPDELGFELAPGASVGDVTHDSLGFRDVERPLVKPPGTFRILALGDSITYGTGLPLERTYPKLLEQMLDSPKARVEVWNGGVSGYNARQEALWLERHGLAIAPDLVLVEACANDLGPRQVETRSTGGLEIREYAPPLVPLALGSGPVARATARASALVRVADRVAAVARSADAPPPLLDLQAEKNAAAYRSIRDDATAAGAKVAILVFPMLGPADAGLEAVRRRIGEIAHELRIPALDLADAFRALPAAELRVVPDDPWHPNATGDAIAAQAAAGFLHDAGLLPAGIRLELAAGGAAAPVRIAPPALEVVRVTSAPRIDGHLDDLAWRSVPPVASFVPLPDEPVVPSRPTVAWLAHDGQRLYIAFRCGEPRPDRLRRTVLERDGDRIWEDDDVELFVAPDESPDAPYFQVILNAAGALYDREHRGREAAWNAAGIEAAIDIGADAWTAEIALPFAALGVAPPADGTHWRVNLARHVSAGEPHGQWLTWTPLSGDSLLQPESFGTLMFAGARRDP